MPILPFISKGQHFQKGGDVEKTKVPGREILSKVEVRVPYSSFRRHRPASGDRSG